MALNTIPQKPGWSWLGSVPLPLPTLTMQVVDGWVTVAGPFSARPRGHSSQTIVGTTAIYRSASF
jgi:hypothetical protein